MFRKKRSWTPECFKLPFFENTPASQKTLFQYNDLKIQILSDKSKVFIEECVDKAFIIVGNSSGIWLGKIPMKCWLIVIRLIK